MGLDFVDHLPATIESVRAACHRERVPVAFQGNLALPAGTASLRNQSMTCNTLLRCGRGCESSIEITRANDKFTQLAYTHTQ